MDELLSWLSKHNLNINPILDGKTHRFSMEGENDDAGWYIGSSVIVPSGKEILTMTVSSWRWTEKLYFRSGGGFKNGEFEAYKIALEKRKKETDAEEERIHKEAAERARKIWQASKEANDGHDYLQKKQIKAIGIRENQGSLIIPVYASNGEIQSIQRIFPDGTKRFLPGGRTKAGYFKLDGNDEAILLCEGYATAVSCHQATGYTCYVSFNAGNLLPVAKYLREKLCGNSKIIICGDDDRFTEGNPGREKAIEAAKEIACKVVFPKFDGTICTDSENKFTDFNDLHCWASLEVVKKQILLSVGAPQISLAVEVPNLSGEDTKHEEEHEEIKTEFPLECVPEILRAPIPVLAELISVPIEIVCSSIFAAAALCVQEFYDIEIFGSRRPISLFFITIAESGERKTTVDNKALYKHKEWAKEKFDAYLKEQARYKDAMEEWKNPNPKEMSKRGSRPKAPKAPMLFVSEPTMEGLFQCLKSHRDSVGIFADEGGAFLGGHSMKSENIKATLGKLNQLWDGSPIDRMRKGKDESEIDVLHGKRVCTHLMIQTKIANELFGNEYAKAQGFLARCLTVFPKSKIGERKFNSGISMPNEMGEFNNRVRYFLDKQKLTDSSRVLEFSIDANKKMENFYYEIEPQLKKGGKYYSVKDFASKLVEHCARLAAVFEVFSFPDTTVVSGKTMQAAIEIGRFYLDEQLRVTGGCSMFESKEGESLYTFLNRKDKWQLRDVLRGCPKKLRKKKILIDVLKQLEHGGYCKFDEKSHEITL